MKKENSVLIIVVIVLVIAIVGVAFFVLRENPTSQTNIPSPTPLTSSATEGQAENRYIEYSKTGYENSKNQRHVLFFYANWCPTCRPADAEFQNRMSEIPDGVIVVRINYNDDATDADEKTLADQYRITYQHTFVLLENGVEVKRWNGGGIDELLEQVM